MTSANQYQSLLQEAEQHVQLGDYSEAQRLLMRAHGAGHAVKADHLGVHRALIALGIRKRDPLQVASQSALWVLALLFD